VVAPMTIDPIDHTCAYSCANYAHEYAPGAAIFIQRGNLRSRDIAGLIGRCARPLISLLRKRWTRRRASSCFSASRFSEGDFSRFLKEPRSDSITHAKARGEPRSLHAARERVESDRRNRGFGGFETSTRRVRARTPVPARNGSLLCRRARFRMQKPGKSFPDLPSGLTTSSRSAWPFFLSSSVSSRVPYLARPSEPRGTPLTDTLAKKRRVIKA